MSFREIMLDLRNRKLYQILCHFGGHGGASCRAKALTQDAECARWRNDNEIGDAIVTHQAVELLGNLREKHLFGLIVPIRLLCRASSAALGLVDAALAVRSKIAG